MKISAQNYRVREGEKVTLRFSVARDAGRASSSNCPKGGDQGWPRAAHLSRV